MNILVYDLIRINLHAISTAHCQYPLRTADSLLTRQRYLWPHGPSPLLLESELLLLGLYIDIRLLIKIFEVELALGA